MSCPSTRMAPESTSQNLGNRLMSVVLPQPLGPTRAMVSPCLTVRLMPLSRRRTAVVAEVDAVKLDGSIDAAAGASAVGSFDDLGLAVHQGADPVGRRRGALDLRVHVGQLANRVGGTGEHGVQRQQLLDRHDLRGELELQLDQARDRSSD